ncbi:MAG: sulfite exporter TauE/SafE family protein [Planctomycetes bacterium]|nr:sulfite exporter TauE/SafE family protein [Planctomycetota bacterium]
MMDWIIPDGATSHPATYMLVTVLAFMLMGVDKGGFGGVGMLSVPLLMMVAPAQFVLGMWLPLLVLCDIFTLRAYPKEWQLRPLLLLAPGAICGLGVGYLLLNRIEPWMIKLCVGGLAVGFVGLDALRTRLVRRIAGETPRSGWRPSLLTASPFGLAAGVTTMVAHAAGPITSVYFIPQRMDPRTFAGTCGRYYFVFNSLKVPFFVVAGLINAQTLLKSLWLVPLAPVAVLLGSAMNRRLTTTSFTRVVYALLFVSGLYLIYANATGPN